MRVRYISAGSLDYYLNKPGIVIVDIRGTDEYEESHFQGAINIPYEEFEKRLVQRDFNEFDREKTYVMYCDRGTMSLSICNRLSSMGYRTITVVGGIRQYRGNHLTR